MDHDDLLPPRALYDGRRDLAPHPDSRPDPLFRRGSRSTTAACGSQPTSRPTGTTTLLLGQNMVSHLGVYRRQPAGGRWAACARGSRAARTTTWSCGWPSDHPGQHPPYSAVLYHWRQTGQGSFSEGAPERCAAASRRAIAGHLARSGGGDAEVLPNPHLPLWSRVVRPLPEPAPRVSVILQGWRAPGGAGKLRCRAAGGLRLPRPRIACRGRRRRCAGPVVGRRAPCASWPTPTRANPAAGINRACAEASGEVLLLLDRELDTAGARLAGGTGIAGAAAGRRRRRRQAAGRRRARAPVRAAARRRTRRNSPAATSRWPHGTRPGYAGRLQMLREAVGGRHGLSRGTAHGVRRIGRA